MPQNNEEVVTPPNPNPDPTPVITDHNSQNPPSNQPTSPPARVFTDADMTRTHELYGEALREQTARNERLQRELEDARRNPQQSVDTSTLTPEQLIDRQIQLSVKPLVDEFTLFRQSQQANTYINLKNQFRSLPQLAPYFTTIEPYVDQEMQGKDVTVQNLQNAIAVVIGKIQMQSAVAPQQVAPAPAPVTPPVNNNQPRNDNMLPPHLRPSTPPAPDGNRNVPLRQLTELEKRVAREQGKTDAEYLAWIDVDPRDVVRSTIGRPTT